MFNELNYNDYRGRVLAASNGRKVHLLYNLLGNVFTCCEGLDLDPDDTEYLQILKDVLFEIKKITGVSCSVNYFIKEV